MPNTLILTRAQAAAAHQAMTALNAVGAKLKASFGCVSTEGVNVFEETGGTVRVVRVQHYDVLESEDYRDQAAFAIAYGVTHP